MASSEENQEIISSLPTRKGLWRSRDLYLYEGFWCSPSFLQGIISAQQIFIPQPNDIILSSTPKSGTTWLKALAFLVVTRHRFDESSSPLLSKVPHECLPLLEIDLNDKRIAGVPLVSTHIPYTSLPKSIVSAGCKIVYICREPKDLFISMWYFVAKLLPNGAEIIPIEKAFELFCEGITIYGPYWEHVLGYWKASLDFPDKILFLKYEEMKKDTRLHVKRLADFIGYPFSVEEEQNGAVEKIIEICSFDSLSNLEVNKTGKRPVGTLFTVENNAYFRKGGVGDWKNHLTPEMAACLDGITEHKFRGSGLSF